MLLLGVSFHPSFNGRAADILPCDQIEPGDSLSPPNAKTLIFQRTDDAETCDRTHVGEHPLSTGRGKEQGSASSLAVGSRHCCPYLHHCRIGVGQSPFDRGHNRRLPGMGHDPRAFPVARAVLMSSSVLFVFQSVRLTDRVSGEKLLMTDGAMTARFPAQLVRRNSSSIGFRLRPPPGHHPHHEIRGPVGSATAVIGAGISAREDLPPMCGPLDRVVEVVGRPQLTRLRRLPEPRCRAV